MTLGWAARRRWARRAPRRLQFTRTGKGLIGLAFAVGLAALNTGNNLLLLGWSMVLCAIILSGVLSEGCLRLLHCRLQLTEMWRVGEPATVTFAVGNDAKLLPAFAVLFTAAWRHQSAPARPLYAVHAPYALRLLPKTRRSLLGTASPPRRGRYVLEELRATTSYPFGFFIKIRPLPQPSIEVLCAPQQVKVHSLIESLLGGSGDAPQNTPGPSDTLLFVRPFRDGDERRRIDWRRSLRAKALMVRETERMGGKLIMLCLLPSSNLSEAAAEKAISTLGSLAEALLLEHFEVGIWAPGLLLTPSSGATYGREILSALALMDHARPVPPLSFEANGYAWVHLAGSGFGAPDGFFSTPVSIA